MKTKISHIVRWVSSSLILGSVITVNVLSYTVFDRALRTFVGETSNAVSNDTSYIYNKSPLTSAELLKEKNAYAKEVVGEGVVLLKREGNYLPYKKGTKFSFFSASSATLVGGGDLKSSFTSAGFEVNETLWNFYSNGEGSKYKKGSGSISFGDAMDYSINECPLSVIKSVDGLESSFAGTTAVFVISRTCGEGVDPCRAMYNGTSNVNDWDKSYQELDSTELEIISYLNSNFSDVVILVNDSNPFELGWVEDYPNIHSVLSMACPYGAGIGALGEIFSGAICPSGKTVDTWAKDSLSSPAAQNSGDFAYYYNNQATSYNYLTYKEGIYVGYKYYETRYEDAILNQGNAGEYSYKDQVSYPFGYGLSYTSFEWSDYKFNYDEDSATFTSSITVKNTGDCEGKDVVEIFAQKPYTSYDKMNLVEKSSLDLVGFAKTKSLKKGESETITITFNREKLKSFDKKGKNTYIIEDGDYYFVAAKDAHEAINGILSSKGVGNSELDRDTFSSFVSKYNFKDITFDNDGTNSTLYGFDTATGTKISSQLDCAERDDITYLTRQDWVNTFPTPDGEVSSEISIWGNIINGKDSNGNPVGYVFKKDLTEAELNKAKATGRNASLNPDVGKYANEEIVTSAGNDVSLIDLRGKDFSDPLWESLLDNLSPSDYVSLIAQSGYGSAALTNIGKPSTNDRDAATGLIVTKSMVNLPNMVVLAQTYNTELSHRFGNIVGMDGLIGGNAGKKVNGWYAPAMNIHRSPFTARAGEYYSEDPFLSGEFASESATGASEYGMYTFIKHFAMNEQDLHRGDRGQGGLITWFNEQSARELYLVPFERCFKAKTVEQHYFQYDKNGNIEEVSYQLPAVMAVMTSFNRLGFTWAGGNYNLLTEILRTEWGFNGFVLTDYDNGGYMDTEQMIYAGADGKLNTMNTCNWSFNGSDGDSYHYSRLAAKRILYTICNSAAMNGLIHGVAATDGIAYYTFILIGLDIIGAVGIFFLIFPMYHPLKKKKKE